MARINRFLDQSLTNQYRGAGTNYVVQTPTGAVYIIYVNGVEDVVFIKTTDGGLTWSLPITVFTGTTTQLSVWYDRWSNIAAGLIHCAYTETTGHDVLYRSIDTENSDTLGTQTTIFDGVSAVGSNGFLSITRARGGNLGCVFCIDAGAEDGFAKSTDVGATWAAGADPTEGQTLDQVILLPGWAADNQDLMMFFWDQSASEISRKLFDDSGDSWGETSIAASMTANTALTDYPHFAAAVDITNSRNVLIAWSARDTANADLRCWTVTESAITETASNVVLNSTDDQGLAALAIDTATQTWYALYAGKSDGSETMNTSAHFYYKLSTDAGANWGSETQFSDQLRNRQWLVACPRFSGALIAASTTSPPAGSILLAVSTNIPTGGGGIIGG